MVLVFAGPLEACHCAILRNRQFPLEIDNKRELHMEDPGVGSLRNLLRKKRLGLWWRWVWRFPSHIHEYRKAILGRGSVRFDSLISSSYRYLRSNPGFCKNQGSAGNIGNACNLYYCLALEDRIKSHQAHVAASFCSFLIRQ